LFVDGSPRLGECSIVPWRTYWGMLTITKPADGFWAAIED